RCVHRQAPTSGQVVPRTEHRGWTLARRSAHNPAMPIFKRWPILVVALLFIVATIHGAQNVPPPSGSGAAIRLSSASLGSGGAGTLDLDGWFYETASGRTPLPAALTGAARTVS